MKKRKLITKKELRKAVSRSSKLEGISFKNALKDNIAIKLLKKHGRAFSL